MRHFTQLQSSSVERERWGKIRGTRFSITYCGLEQTLNMKILSDGSRVKVNTYIAKNSINLKIRITKTRRSRKMWNHEEEPWRRKKQRAISVIKGSKN